MHREFSQFFYSWLMAIYRRRGAVIRHRNTDDCQEEEVEEEAPAPSAPFPLRLLVLFIVQGEPVLASALVAIRIA